MKCVITQKISLPSKKEPACKELIPQKTLENTRISLLINPENPSNDNYSIVTLYVPLFYQPRHGLYFNIGKTQTFQFGITKLVKSGTKCVFLFLKAEQIRQKRNGRHV